MIILLDTSVAINALRDREGGNANLARIVREGHTFSISVITVGEIYAGLRGGEESKTKDVLSSMACHPIRGYLTRRAGELRSSWRRKGRTPELADMMIAATALQHNVALVTDNRKDLPMGELRFYPN